VTSTITTAINQRNPAAVNRMPEWVQFMRDIVRLLARLGLSRFGNTSAESNQGITRCTVRRILRPPALVSCPRRY
jgi:hypothetical protein